MFARLALALLVSGMLFASAGQANAADYNFTALGLGAFQGPIGTAYDINNAGQIATDSYFSSKHTGGVWSNSAYAILDNPGGRSYQGEGINDAGQVAGYVTNSSGYRNASVWSNGVITSSLASLGGNNSDASAINNAGQVVGGADTTTGTMHATLWSSNGTVTDLGASSASYSSAVSINNSGQVVGTLNNHATLWSNGGTSRTDLGTLGGTSSGAYGINDAGLIVGNSKNSSGYNHATLWSNSGTTMVDLGTLTNYGTSFAQAISTSGLIAGKSDVTGVSGTHAALWTVLNGVVKGTDLNTFLDASSVNAGWVLQTAFGINDAGSIVGQAYNTKTFATDAYVLAAVPEPESYAMLLAGLGLIGAIARRRKQ